MINFIICDDDKEMKKKIEKMVDSFMMKKDIDYKTYLFDDYSDDFMNIVNKKLPSKIYILDIETPTRTGIDVARIIRHKDEDSAIIFITGHEDLGPRLLSKDITFLAFINKFDDCEGRLNRNLQKAMDALERKQSLKFEDHGVLYMIPIKDILYICKDTIDRKSIIKTDYNEFRVYTSLANLLNLLDSEQFIQTHRSCLVNKNRMVKYHKMNRTIMFDNGLEIDLVSTRFKAEELI